MCGIAGIIDKTGRPVGSSTVLEMLETMPYRGPNDRGTFCDGPIGLGHLRLSILDLSQNGHQPMKDNTGDLTIVFNGEIFNYLEIKEELEKTGHTFHTHSDTEVILAAYRAWGSACVSRFNGMWSFALWDRAKQTLFCSRDRFGVKPFFYHDAPEHFFFASEMKAILSALPQKPEMNGAYLYQYLDRNVSEDPTDTVFQGIKMLPPGHNLIVSEGKLSVEQYWRVDLARFRASYDYTDPVATFRELLVDAVRLRLRSDVPVGVCLSGGLDSSTIVGIISGILGQKISVFSSVYADPKYNEEEFLDAVLERYPNTVHKITPDPKRFFAVMDQVVAHHDEPIRMPSTFSQWHIFQCVHDHKITVTLDGQGADELLGGYREYYPSYLATLFRDVLRTVSFKKLHTFFRTRKDIKTYLGRNFDKDVLKLLLPKKVLAMKRRFAPVKRWQDTILAEEFIARYRGTSVAEKENVSPFRDPLSRHLFETFSRTNLPMVLDFEDRISMAFSVEARTPFLDYRIVEFCMALPYEYKMDGYRNKAILRDAFKDVLPEKVFARKDKKGFPTPNEHWFRDEVREELRAIVYSDSLVRHGVFDPKKVRDLFERHQKGENHERLLVRVASTELWMRKYFD